MGLLWFRFWGQNPGKSTKRLAVPMGRGDSYREKDSFQRKGVSGSFCQVRVGWATKGLQTKGLFTGISIALELVALDAKLVN